MDDEGERDDDGYGRRVGDRLRTIRRQKGLSLQEVEAGSDQEFKASVVGAYERGERAISVPRLRRLAGFYNVPVDQLLPRQDGDTTSGQFSVIDLNRTDGPAGGVPETPVTIDLRTLEALDSSEAVLLGRYLGMIQVQRGDFNGRVLTIRRDDLRAIACILDTSVDTTITRLEDLGLSLAG